MYAKLQGEDVPEVFKHPEQFNSTYKELDPNEDPHKLIYRTTNGEYGNWNPSLIEMPTVYRGKANNFVKSQNNIVYRDSRMNCEMDKNRWMDPECVVIRK